MRRSHLSSFIITVFICLFSIQSSIAQRVGLGATVGFNQSTHQNNFKFTSGDIDLDLKPQFRTGGHVGIVFRRILSNNLRLQTEPQYIELGGGYDGTFVVNNFELRTVSETNIKYIQIPLLIQYTTTPPDRQRFPKPWPEFTFHLTAGLYGSYLLDADFSGRVTGAPIGVQFEDVFSNDVTSQFHEYDAGLVFGGGTEFGLNTKIGSEARLIYGLMNTGERSSTSFDPKNISITFSLYYLF